MCTVARDRPRWPGGRRRSNATPAVVTASFLTAFQNNGPIPHMNSTVDKRAPALLELGRTEVTDLRRDDLSPASRSLAAFEVVTDELEDRDVLGGVVQHEVDEERLQR